MKPSPASRCFEVRRDAGHDRQYRDAPLHVDRVLLVRRIRSGVLKPLVATAFHNESQTRHTSGHCRGPMRIIAFITQASVIDQCLAHRRDRAVRLPDTRLTPIEIPIPAAFLLERGYSTP